MILYAYPYCCLWFVDIDECSELDVSGTLCNHLCENVLGGFRCHCHDGYKLDHNGITCKAKGSAELNVVMFYKLQNMAASEGISVEFISQFFESYEIKMKQKIQ